jgi:nicotinate-nucleotide pyrophosphorylase (carboxylating)
VRPFQALDLLALRDLVERSLEEDVGDGDITSEAVVPAGAEAEARIVQKEPGVVYGLVAAAEVFRAVGVESFDPVIYEGTWHDEVPRDVARAEGLARDLLAAERTALNLLGHISGIATLTARFVKAVEGSGARILDTRKTTPGLRSLEKAAVAAGGGENHRMGLYDAVLIKENHIAIAGGIEEAVRRARTADAERPVEIECRDAAEVASALEAGAERLLLDNMTPRQLKAAVKARNAHGGGATLEASGGVTLKNVAKIAATGVEFISVGALTHSAPALDLSMEISAAGATAAGP